VRVVSAAAGAGERKKTIAVRLPQGLERAMTVTLRAHAAHDLQRSSVLRACQALSAAPSLSTK
jgi:hypothetical protein